MPAKYFICPNGEKISIEKCLNKCSTRCMFLPTLRAVANSLDRKLEVPSVTELIAGARETYLKKLNDYAVNPEKQIYALHGSAVHTINEGYTQGNMLTEERLRDQVTSGKFDLYGQIIDASDCVLGDIKVTSSYKLMKALGIYKVEVQTGEVYKTGARKGQMKTAKQLRTGGVRNVLEWAIQLNYYRILLEKQGFTVNKMLIQAMCRDANLRIASERGIDKNIYIIKINKISDVWVKKYMAKKAEDVTKALAENKVPAVCNFRQRWGNRKCLGYCDVAEFCDYGRSLKTKLQGKIS